MTLLIIYLLLAVGVSFLCSILESVLLSLTPSFVKAQQDAGAVSGRLMHGQKTDLDKPLAAILTLNTAAHTVGAAGVGAQAHLVFNNLPTTVISALLTLVILIFSEIIPKTIGANFWRVLAIPSAYLIHGMTLSLWPFVVLSQYLSKLITPKNLEPSISRDEMIAMADIGHQQGIIDEADARTLQSVMRFQSLRAHEVLTPRTVVQSLSSDMTVRQAREAIAGQKFSRYPVLEKSEHILGYVLQSDILSEAAEDRWERPLVELVRPVPMILESLPLKGAMSIFLKEREHLAVVIDEFGIFMGVITLEDVVESLIGLEIMDEADDVEDMRMLARETLAKRHN